MMMDIIIRASLIAFVIATAFSIRTILNRLKELEGEVDFLKWVVKDTFIESLERRCEEKVEKEK